MTYASLTTNVSACYTYFVRNTTTIFVFNTHTHAHFVYAHANDPTKNVKKKKQHEENEKKERNKREKKLIPASDSVCHNLLCCCDYTLKVIFSLQNE